MPRCHMASIGDISSKNTVYPLNAVSNVQFNNRNEINACLYKPHTNYPCAQLVQYCITGIKGLSRCPALTPYYSVMQ